MAIMPGHRTLKPFTRTYYGQTGKVVERLRRSGNGRAASDVAFRRDLKVVRPCPEFVPKLPVPSIGSWSKFRTRSADTCVRRLGFIGALKGCN